MTDNCREEVKSRYPDIPHELPCCTAYAENKTSSCQTRQTYRHSAIKITLMQAVNCQHREIIGNTENGTMELNSAAKVPLIDKPATNASSSVPLSWICLFHYSSFTFRNNCGFSLVHGDTSNKAPFEIIRSCSTSRSSNCRRCSTPTSNASAPALKTIVTIASLALQ